MKFFPLLSKLLKTIAFTTRLLYKHCNITPYLQGIGPSYRAWKVARALLLPSSSFTLHKKVWEGHYLVALKPKTELIQKQNLTTELMTPEYIAKFNTHFIGYHWSPNSVCNQITENEERRLTKYLQTKEKVHFY